MPKKCPACNSIKYQKIENDFKCARCGFINKSNNKKLDSQITNIL
ncbi:MAG: hypothetical protein V1888_03935 [archaeon]